MESTPEELGDPRRRFLMKAGVATATATATVVASVGGLGLGARPAAAAPRQDARFDVDAATLAAGIELAAVAVYQAAAARGLLDEATLGLITTFAGHHQDHAGTFNAFLAANGQEQVMAPHQGLLDQYGPLIAEAVDATALLDVAHTLEESAASTYVASLGRLSDPEAALAVSRILPVEAQHALVLATAIGSPIDDRLPAFETTDNSLLGS